MQYHIQHHTTYTYDQSVFLKPHTLRLRPRSDGWQKLWDFSLSIDPQPTGISQVIDFDGNSLLKIWFTQPTEKLILAVRAKVETFISNPFDYLLEPWATTLPFDYPSSVLTQLQPYLTSDSPPSPLIELAQEILHYSQGNPMTFLSILNQRIYQTFGHIVRETGEPWLSSITWKRKQGSCRDTAVLFMEICRVVGLATRFVSGYQEGDRHQEQRDLHAWVEVYLPGGGWRGYDPTHGLAVADGHIALATSPIPQQTVPVIGHITPVRPAFESSPKSTMEVCLIIDRDD